MADYEEEIDIQRTQDLDLAREILSETSQPIQLSFFLYEIDAFLPEAMQLLLHPKVHSLFIYPDVYPEDTVLPPDSIPANGAYHDRIDRPQARV